MLYPGHPRTLSYIHLIVVAQQVKWVEGLCVGYMVLILISALFGHIGHGRLELLFGTPQMTDAHLGSDACSAEQDQYSPFTLSGLKVSESKIKLGKCPCFIAAMKTLSDYINWRVKEPPVQHAEGPNTWRPPTLPVMYDKPQTTLVSPLDTDPIINRVLRRPKIPGATRSVMCSSRALQRAYIIILKRQGNIILLLLAAPRSIPIWGTPGWQFFAGVWSGAMITFIFTCKPLGHKEVEDLVKYDPG